MSYNLPNEDGFFGEFGGSFIPDNLKKIMEEINIEYQNARKDPAFLEELQYLYQYYVGRPSPLFYAKNLSKKYGANFYLKREDLNHTGAHKINHCLGEALLAKRLGKKKVIAETGAGQHGVALATAAALLGLECDIYMGEIDIKKERPNVIRMKILGANIIPVKSGQKTLKEAVDECFEAYIKDPVTQLYAIGSVVGPHPFPMMVRDFQSIVGKEIKEQFSKQFGGKPQHIVACVGGGSNSMGVFYPFIDDTEVALHGIEPGGTSSKLGCHASSLTYGTPGIIHGFKCFMLKGENDEPANVYSVASGLDYPGVGPEHSYLKHIQRAQYEIANDKEAIDAFFDLSKVEGIIPALESSHAVAGAIKIAKRYPGESIVVNVSGRGDKDIDFIIEKYGAEYGVTF